MSRKKVRDKQYNPIKALQSALQIFAKKIVMTSKLSVNDGRVRLWNKFKKHPFTINQTEFKMLHDQMHKWTMILVVWSYESNGKERTVTRFVQSPIYCYHTELITSLNENHQEMIALEQSKGNDPYDAGWIALPYDYGQLTDKQIETLIDTYITFLDYAE
jgi:hypothetical protein